MLTAIGIRHLGSKNSQLVADHYQTWDNFKSAVYKAAEGDEEAREDLISIGGLGEVIANSVIETFQNRVFNKLD